MMATSKIEIQLHYPITLVWAVVTDLVDYHWRSDLSKIEVCGNSFVEYTKDGYQTTFTITAFDAPNCYEFDLENDNIIGHWQGMFEEKDSGTYLVFNEMVQPKKWWLKPFVKGYLRRQQNNYAADLKKALAKRYKGD